MDSTYLFKSFNRLKLNQMLQMLVLLMLSLSCLVLKTHFLKMMNQKHFYLLKQNHYLETQTMINHLFLEITKNPPFLEIIIMNKNNHYLADKVQCLQINLIFLRVKMIQINNKMAHKVQTMSIILHKMMEQSLWCN